MIIGQIGKTTDVPLAAPTLRDGLSESLAGAVFFSHHYAAVALTKTGVATLDGEGKSYQHPDGGFAVIQGNIYNHAEFAAAGAGEDARIVFNLCAGGECDSFARLNGGFAAVHWSAAQHRLTLLRDHLGIEPLYYYENGDGLLFSTSLRSLLQHRRVGRELDPLALYRYLLFNYNPATETLIKRVKKVPPGHALVFEQGRTRLQRYWDLSYRDQFAGKSEPEYREELLALLREAIRLRLPDAAFRPGAFLSGGMDSSSVVGLMRPMLGDAPIHTFSFRCEGKSFDESAYARIMATRYHTHHHQVEFPPDEVRHLEALVGQMDEPFSDIGIELASFLLGREAGGRVHYVLTGDGGDELFAGHPVYLADNVARKFELVPRLLRRVVTGTFQHLPDTDDKKSLTVKLKRFSYSCNFPATLYSNRWRMYYTDAEVRHLCRAEILASVNGTDPTRAIAELYDRADGADDLSRTLYGDYHTVVDFYLRRLQLIRAFGVEARTPMFDPRLVEYAARIPAALKIRNAKETKYILHRTMAGVLPDEIVFRKDKLGHSVPMKNWMRDARPVRELITSVLSPEALRRRGFFNSEVVQTMIKEHLRRRHNHSHRLWSLMMLELWLQKNVSR